jgi:hypothetical protein
MTADPTAAAVTSPALETVAMLGALDSHVMVRPVRTFPAESLSRVVRFAEAPTSRSAVAGSTLTDATDAGGAAVTTTCAVPDLPSLVARIVVVPGATA